MGSLLAVAAGMRTIGLLITLLAVAPQAATDQKPVVPEGTIITSAQVTGFDIDRLSPGLRQEIRNLAGTPLKQERLDELAARIEAERPRYVAAVRAVMESDGQARVFFVVGRQSEPDRDDNVNARYIVEQADITGVPDDELTQALRDDLQGLVGKRLDSDEADRLRGAPRTRASPLRGVPAHPARERSWPHPARVRGQQEGAATMAALRAAPIERVYHSEQGWGSYLDLGIGDRNIRFTPIVAIDNADDLVEEYSGCGLRFETRKLGTRRLGASLEWSWFDQDWRGATLDALAVQARDSRSVRHAIDDHAAAEVRLQPGPQRRRRRQHLGAGAARPRRPTHRWRTRRSPRSATTGDGRTAPMRTHHVEASFGVRAGSRELESDLAYTRYLGQGSYRYDFGRHHVQATGMAGGITGHAPLFERFTLGDSTDAARLGQVRHRAGRRRPDGLLVDRIPLYRARAVPRHRIGLGRGHRAPGPRLDGFRFPRGAGVPGRWLPAEHRQPERRLHDGSPDLGAWDPVVAPSVGEPPRSLLALLAVAGRRRSSAQTLTVDTVGDALKIRAPGFSFLKGEPLARLKDGRSVRVELAAMVLPGPREVAAGDEPADLRLELRSLGGTIRRDRRWTRAPSRSRT